MFGRAMIGDLTAAERGSSRTKGPSRGPLDRHQLVEIVGRPSMLMNLIPHRSDG